MPPKPTRDELERAAGKRLPDIAVRGLRFLLIGINPSLYSAAVGHHFARPGNRFWPALYRSGMTPVPLTPQEDHRVPEFGLGLTNIVARATARADELEVDELRDGARQLGEKLRRWRPQWAVFLGISAYRRACDRPRAILGRQPETLADTPLWVLPNPSGLNAHYQLPRLAELFGELITADPLA